MKYHQVISENRRFIYLIEERENDEYAILAFHDELNGAFASPTSYWASHSNKKLFSTDKGKVRKLTNVRKHMPDAKWKRVTKQYVLTELL